MGWANGMERGTNGQTNSYIEYGGTGSQKQTMPFAKYAKETTTPGLFDVYLNIRGNVQKEIAPVRFGFSS